MNLIITCTNPSTCAFLTATFIVAIGPYLDKESLPHSVTLFLVIDGRDGDVQATNGSGPQLHAECLTSSNLYHQLAVVR